MINLLNYNNSQVRTHVHEALNLHHYVIKWLALSKFVHNFWNGFVQHLAWTIPFINYRGIINLVWTIPFITYRGIINLVWTIPFITYRGIINLVCTIPFIIHRGIINSNLNREHNRPCSDSMDPNKWLTKLIPQKWRNVQPKNQF